MLRVARKLRRYRSLWPFEVYRDTEYSPSALVVRITKPRWPRKQRIGAGFDRVVNMTQIITALDVCPSEFSLLLRKMAEPDE